MAIDDARLARPYAEAAHKHAQAAAGKSAAAWGDLLDGFAAALADARLQAALADPRVGPGQAQAVIDGVLDKLGTGGDQDMAAFATQLLENGRLGVVGTIATQYAALRRRAEGVLDAEIHTAFELDAKRVAAIASQLKKRFAMREVNTKVVTDKSLIGGIIIIAGDDVIDGSVTAQLNQLHVALQR